MHVVTALSMEHTPRMEGGMRPCRLRVLHQARAWANARTLDVKVKFDGAGRERNCAVAIGDRHVGRDVVQHGQVDASLGQRHGAGRGRRRSAGADAAGARKVGDRGEVADRQRHEADIGAVDRARSWREGGYREGEEGGRETA